MLVIGSCHSRLCRHASGNSCGSSLLFQTLVKLCGVASLPRVLNKSLERMWIYCIRKLNSVGYIILGDTKSWLLLANSFCKPNFVMDQAFCSVQLAENYCL